ncbi:MAG: hypothetical protein GY771_14665 [bacterium]|nr:hypothetical protein [bacterium]
MFNKTLLLIAIICIASGSASAMSRGWAVPLEVVGGYGVGIGSSVIAYGSAGGFSNCVGTLKGILAIFVVYPAASALGVYAVGELAEGDSTNDALSLGATLGASYGSFIASFAFRELSAAMAIILPPLVDTLVYNLVKDVDEDNGEIRPAGRYTHLVSFSVGF